MDNINKFTVSSRDFISENTGRFREFYSIGSALGTGRFFFTNEIGAFGEVRKCVNRKTGVIRAVKIIKKESLDAKEKVRFF